MARIFLRGAELTLPEAVEVPEPAELGPSPLEELLKSAVAREGTLRRSRAHELNLALEGAGVNHAPAICRLLEDAEFLKLEDNFGESCRAMGVAALLRCGFPWALHITPEDLAFARSRPRRKSDDGMQIGALGSKTVAVAVTMIGVMAFLAGAGDSFHNLALALAGLLMTVYGVLGFGAASRRPRRQSLLATALWGGALMVILGLMLPFTSDALLILGTGLTGLMCVATFLFSFAMPRVEQKAGF